MVEAMIIWPAMDVFLEWIGLGEGEQDF